MHYEYMYEKKIAVAQNENFVNSRNSYSEVLVEHNVSKNSVIFLFYIQVVLKEMELINKIIYIASSHLSSES